MGGLLNHNRKKGGQHLLPSVMLELGTCQAASSSPSRTHGQGQIPKGKHHLRAEGLGSRYDFERGGLAPMTRPQARSPTSSGTLGASLRQGDTQRLHLGAGGGQHLGAAQHRRNCGRGSSGLEPSSRAPCGQVQAKGTPSRRIAPPDVWGQGTGEGSMAGTP